MKRKPHVILVLQCDGYPDEEIPLTKKQFTTIEKASKIEGLSIEQFINQTLVKALDRGDFKI